MAGVLHEQRLGSSDEYVISKLAELVLSRSQNVPEAPNRIGKTPLPGTVRFAQKPTESLVAPGGITRFQSKAGVTEITPESAEKFPFQFV